MFNLVCNKVEFIGKSYIVYDRINEVEVEGYNEDHVQSVASISKIMTAILVIENKKLDEMVTVDDTINKAYGSCVYIHIKDKLTIQDLLYGLMLRSGNDCALMLAKATAGSVDQFVKMMNELAGKLELSNTHFSNPTGLDEEDDGNCSSVRDMAKLMAYCSHNPIFNHIVESQTYKRQDGNGTWHNKNRLLKEYEYCVGGKTGYTKKAKRTLVTRAVKDDTDLIIVTFNCGNDFEFHKNKYEEVFDYYKKVKIFDQGIHKINDKVYVFDESLYVNAQQGDKVEVSIVDQHLLVLVNNKCVKKEILQPYHFLSGLKLVLRDMIYG